MTRKVIAFEIVLTVAMLAAVIALYSRLPEEFVTHWDSSLQPNGYSPKWFYFVLGPGVMAALTAFTIFGPWLSPKKFEIESFQSTFDLMMLMLFCATTYFAAVMLWAGWGHPGDGGRAIQGGVCVLFAALGNVMGKVRRNFYLGIKTPWALASERVWNGTHRLAAKTFVVAGLLGLLFTVLDVRVWTMYALMVGALAPAIYSLVLYKRLESRGELQS